jgi:hypothetical protein
MSGNQGLNDNDIRPTAEEIISLCRSDLEAMYNLEYLFRIDAEAPANILEYARLMSLHLKRMEGMLCSRLPKMLG